MPYKSIADKNRYSRKQYRARIAAGVCGSCGKAPKIIGMSVCESCKEANRKVARDRMRRIRASLKALGICTSCTVRQAMPGYTQCGACAEYRDEHRTKKVA